MVQSLLLLLFLLLAISSCFIVGCLSSNCLSSHWFLSHKFHSLACFIDSITILFLLLFLLSLSCFLMFVFLCCHFYFAHCCLLPTCCNFDFFSVYAPTLFSLVILSRHIFLPLPRCLVSPHHTTVLSRYCLFVSSSLLNRCVVVSPHHLSLSQPRCLVSASLNCLFISSLSHCMFSVSPLLHCFFLCLVVLSLLFTLYWYFILSRHLLYLF